MEIRSETKLRNFLLYSVYKKKGNITNKLFPIMVKHENGNSELYNALLLLRIVTNKFSQRIINLLKEKGKMNVTDIYNELQLKQSVVSQHIANLQKIGVIISTRVGRVLYKELDEMRFERIKHIASFINKP